MRAKLAVTLLSIVCLGVVGAEKGHTKKLTQQELEEKEQLEASAEEQAEMSKTGLGTIEYSLTGTIHVAQQDGTAENGPLGILESKEGTYILKCEVGALRKQLLRKYGKVVTLMGRLRNQSKYFIVTAIVDIKIPPPVTGRIVPAGL